MACQPVKLIVYLLYEQSGLEELEVEYRSAERPAIGLALKETRTDVCFKVTKCHCPRTTSRAALWITSAAIGRDDTHARMPSKKYVQSKEDKERCLAVSTCGRQQKVSPAAFGGNAGLMSTEHSEVRNELLKQDPPRMLILFKTRV